ncbi:MAG: BREX-3 system P-loop-containing protein BrxF [Desulfosoma sp.]
MADEVLRKIGEARKLYYRLILMVGPAGSGKTSALHEVSARASAPLVNVNLQLSRRMLDLTERQRALQLPRLLGDIVGEARGELVLLDGIEFLFDCPPEAGSIASASGIVPEQDGRCRQERKRQD